MLDYAQTFQEFSSSLKPMDLALYAGAGIILWVLFKERLSPVQKILTDLLSKVKVSLSQPKTSTNNSVNKDLFFRLVESWKQTRDLAAESGCKKAVEVADQMFPYLSPTICGEEKV